ncbi:hypothetical protein HRI_004825300 [Hibiscus trionum]|uniref:RRM domain-containing protein n=1 Tax=Hibiscus trionum TaxID=183268 RepID=A0A9W7MVZ6_HIBTR|nr:hypothetical protein HRI_004825300 [Hibiscus trionum]
MERSRSSNRGGWQNGRRGRSDWTSRKHGQKMVFRRVGVSIFVDNVSRRIRTATLIEAFSEYGSVVDAYIAYDNPKRRFKPAVFAFIRFRSVFEADRAILKGNGRMLDGFRVRVAMAAERVKEPAGIKARDIPRRREAFRDSRSFKEALLGDITNPPGKLKHPMPLRESTSQRDKSILVNSMHGARVDSKEECLRVEWVDSIKTTDSKKCIQIPRDDMKWLKACLVGRIKSMYNAEVVQDALRSDGFNATVCTWNGLLSVIRADSEATKNKIWEVREELLRIWFDELEFLQGFEGKMRVKVLVELKNVPLHLWNPWFFRQLGERWGKVLKVEEETAGLLNFDRAKMILEVQNGASIPERINVLYNGCLHCIKVKVKDFEEERIFIDGGSPADDRFEGRSDASWYEEGVNDDRFNAVDPTAENAAHAEPLLLAIKNVPNITAPAREDIQTDGIDQIIPSESSGVGLFDVQVDSADILSFQQIHSGPKVYLDRPVNPSPTVSDASKLIEIEVGFADGNRSGVSKNQGNSKSLGEGALPRLTSESMVEHMGMANSKLSGTDMSRNVNDMPEGGSQLMLGLSQSPPTPMFPVPVREGLSTENLEALETLRMGKSLGVSFAAPTEVAMAKLMEFEAADKA